MPLSTEIEATYRVVTPCFCGGARQQAEFRLPSFKGVLRFWWRALARARHDCLAALQQEEARLFGSATGGQSRVRMRLTAHPDTTIEPATRVLAGMPGARYLGYGMPDSDRSCLVAPFEVTIDLHCRPSRRGETCSEGVTRSLLEALMAVGLFGGIGARSRKGFGSTVLTGLRVDGRETWTQPGTSAELAERIAGIASHARHVSEYPKYTSLSQHARYLTVNGQSGSPLGLLDEIGQTYKTHLHDVGEVDNLLRAGFGLPRHGGRSQSELTPADDDLTRRASPLFIHIHECSSRPVAVLSLLPAIFLPDDRNGIRGTDRQPGPAAASELCRPVHQLFARLGDGRPQDVREVSW